MGQENHEPYQLKGSLVEQDKNETRDPDCIEKQE